MPNDLFRPERCAELLLVLASPERLTIVRVVSESGPMNVGDIATAADVAYANVSHHLLALKRAGILKCERRGKFVLYRIAPKVLDTSTPNGFLDLGCCKLTFPIRRGKSSVVTKLKS